MPAGIRMTAVARPVFKALLLLSAAGGTVGALAQLPAPPVSPVPAYKYEYDSEGNLVKITAAPDTQAFLTQQGFDALGRHATTTDAKLAVTQATYNLQDSLTSIKDPRNLVTQYKPTGLGDVLQVTSPDTGVANSTYDAAGQVKTTLDARGVLATYSYDELNRLKQVAFTRSGFSQRTLTRTYDQTGTNFGYGIGRLTTATTPDASEAIQYDQVGRVTQTIQTAAGRALTVKYGYTANNLTSLTYPSGRVVSYGWSGGLPLSVGATSAGVPLPVLDQVTMNPFGAIKGWTWRVGGVARAHARTFDTSGRVVRHPLASLVRDITYDEADRIVKFTHYLAATGAASPANDQTFTYDELDRLKTASGTSSWSFTYDANGNRTVSSVGTTTRTHTVSSTSNRVASLTNPTRTLQYDPAGNLTSDIQTGSSANFTGTYNLEGRLAAMARDTSAGVEFGYDAHGRRVSRGEWSGSSANPRVVTLFAYDADHHLLGEYRADGSTIIEYVWFGDTPVAAMVPDAAASGGVQLYAIHADYLGTPRVALDGQGRSRWRWIGEPFGTNAAEEQPTAGLTPLRINLRLPGQQFEAFGGRHYNHFRDYDSTVGKYIQSDPVGLQAGVNTYAYVESDPLNGTDPLGLNRRVVTGPPTSYTAQISNVQVSILVTAIRRYDANFNYATIAPRGYNYGRQDVQLLRDLLRQYVDSAICVANGLPRPRIDYGSTPNGVPFTRHYGTETGPVRNMPGSLLDQVIAVGIPRINSREGSTSYYDAINNVTVVVGRDGIMSSRVGMPTK